MNRRVFMIVGRGRSGTTLLGRILDSHPSVLLPGEYFFPVNLRTRYHDLDIDDTRIDAFVYDLCRERRFADEIEDPAGLAAYLKQESPGNYTDLCLSTYRYLSGLEHGDELTLIGDKHPYYCFFIPELISIFPDVKFVHIVRDYRDNVISYHNVPFDMNSIVALAIRWDLFNRAIMRAARRWPERFFILRYEELIAAPERVLVELCRFLGIGYVAEMLEFHRGNTGGEVSWHSNLSRPLNNKSLGRWREVLDQRHLQDIEQACAVTGDLLGYERITSGGLLPSLRILLVTLLARFYTSLELLLFRLPYGWRVCIINAIRRWKGTG